MKKGFTLVELLVVITIMAIILAVASVSYQKSIQLSRDSKRKADLEQLRLALETYRSENNAYIQGDGKASATLSDLVTDNYISTIPLDPSTNDYMYSGDAASNTYILCASLETGAASQIALCGNNNYCNGPCNYGVTQP